MKPQILRDLRFLFSLVVAAVLLVAPLVFRAPEGPSVGPGCFVGPGRCVCRWAAARPRDRHTRACGSEWSISRPALALPPPTGTAARPSGPSGALHTGGAWSLMCGSARRLEARPGSAIARGHHKSLE